MRAIHCLVFCLPSAFGDFSGPGWAAPVDLTSNTSLVAAAFANITETLLEYMELDGTPSSPAAELIGGISNLTFSLGVFSLHDQKSVDRLQFHHTSPEIAFAANGTHSVDADSIYRVASVTKAMTALAGHIVLNESGWDRSLADVFPALAEYAEAHPSDDDPVNTVAWQDVTLRALAAQIAGVPRDGFPGPVELQISALLGTLDPLASGLPPISPTDTLGNPPCLVDAVENDRADCPLADYIASISNRAPSFQPWTTPGYANNGFTMLGQALAAITGQPFKDLVAARVFAPLGMTSSSVTTPPAEAWSRSVIAGATPEAYFNLSESVFLPSGGAFSSQRDLARFGVGVLNSTLLSPAATRRWLKPVSLTARLQYAVGAPWEIHRYVLPGSQKVVDLYTKLGDSGAYTAFLVLLPDYGLGFTLLSASAAISERFNLLTSVADVVTHTLLPAIEAQAAAESACRFAGVYASAATNTSLTLVVNQTTTPSLDGPGLVVAAWTSNGTDILTSPLAGYLGLAPWRLVPSIDDAAHGRKGYRLVSADDLPSAQPPVGPTLFSGLGLRAGDWISVDATTYGGIGVGLFEFDMDCDGRATAVSLPAFRVKLQREE